MVYLYDVVDIADLVEGKAAGLISEKYSDDGYSIFNYTNAAVYTPGAWDNYAVQQCRGLIVDESNEIVARPWAKFFNHNQPEAGELEMHSPVEVTDKIDGCFSNKTRLNLWGGGTITIGEVVKNKLTPTLIGMNADGELVPSRVTNWFDNGLKDNWLRVELSTPASHKSGAAGFPNRMFVTPNHHVLHEDKYIPIGALKVGDSLTSYIKSFSGLDLFVGGLLGDGSVCKNGKGFNYQECHGESQRKYVEEQRSLFSDGLIRASDTRGGYANSTKVRLQVQAAQVFEDLRNEWYPEGTKRVPCDLSFMNDAVVAKWFMDDGSRANSPLQQDRAVFYTNGFDEEDVRRLAAWLEAEYGVTAKVFNSKGWSIRLNYAKGTINNFWEAIAPYVFPSMEYKLPEEYRGKFTGYPAPVMTLTPIKSYITSIEENAQWQENHYGRAKTRAFDIETETHNYMCQGVLVHNSLGIIYLDSNNNPRVATRGSFESEQAIHATKWLRSQGWELHGLNEITLLVEIVYPENRVVCVQGNTPLTLWDGTHMRMDEIVNHKKGVLLRGVDSDGRVVPTEILGWHDNGYGMDWVTIRTDSYIGSANAPTHITVTPDHQIKTTRGWVPAHTVRVGDEVLSSFKKLNRDALHVIQSSLLGDGCLHGGKTTFFSEGHSSKNDYGKDSHRLMGNLANKLTGPINFDSFHTSPFEELAELRNRWYRDGVKIVPSDLSWMDDFTMAKWIMDDGCLTKDGVNIATHCFTYEEVERLGIWIYERYRVSCHLQKTPSGPLLKINKGRRGAYNDITALWEKVAPYFFKSMAYKVPKEFHHLVETASYPRPQWSLATKPVKVVAVDMQPRKRSGKKQYDLTTTTGNYFAKNLLVHNCDYGDKDSLILLGGVDIATGEYLSPYYAMHYSDWPGEITQVFPYDTLYKALQAPPRPNAEGLCIRYEDKNKIVKIKQEDYLKAHAYLTNCTPLQIWRKVREGYILEDFLQEAPDELVPLVTQYYAEIVANMEDIRRRVNSEWDLLQQSLPEDHSRKQLADAAKGNPHSPALFMLADGKDIEPYLLKKVKPSALP